MRIGLFAFVALLLCGGTARTADPPIVFQTHPVGQVLDNLRSSVDLIAGEKGVKAMNKGIKEMFGEKGFEGLDIGRPIFGYVILAPKPENITAVVALPITGEKEFLDLCERANHQKPKLTGKEKDVYELPPLDPRYKSLMRFSNQYAYIAYGAKPAPNLEPKSLVPLQKIYIPTETGLLAGRIYFDRIPLDVKLALPLLLEEVKKTILGGLPLGLINEPINKSIMPEVEKLITRYVKLAGGADEMAARLSLDLPSGNLVVEATLNGKPGSELSKIIAGRKPTGNKFGGLISTPDTIAGFKFRLPLFEEEIRAAAAAGLETSFKNEIRNAAENNKPFFEELLKGAVRTVKTGQFDIAAGVRGPDKNDAYTVVGVVAFEDTALLEKEFKKVVDDFPGIIKDGITWDEGKAGKVNIHTWKPDNIFGHITKVFGGDECRLAFAFAPQGVFMTLGPDAIATMKESLAVKPANSPVLDIIVNPTRTAKLMSRLNDNREQARVETVFGKEDKLLAATSLSVEGGKELKVTYKIDLRLIPRAMFIREIEQINREQDK